MRGRKPEVLTILSPDISELERDRSQRCVALVSSSACPNCSGNRCRPTARRPRFSAQVRRFHDLANLSTVSALGARRLAR